MLLGQQVIFRGFFFFSPSKVKATKARSIESVKADLSLPLTVR